MRTEQCFGEYLDRNLYPKLREKLNADFERVTDKERQLQGIDVITTINGKTYNLDEKSTPYYPYSPNFTFEIIQTGLMKGWLVEDKATDVYIVCWPRFKEGKGPKTVTSPDDFTGAIVYAVPRKRLLNYLESQGLNKEFLYETAKKMKNAQIKRKNIQKGVFISFSEGIPEKPVNIVISKNILKPLCKHTFELKN